MHTIRLTKAELRALYPELQAKLERLRPKLFHSLASVKFTAANCYLSDTGLFIECLFKDDSHVEHSWYKISSDGDFADFSSEEFEELNVYQANADFQLRSDEGVWL